MTSTRYKLLLRTLYGAAIHSRLSIGDLKALSQELRHGRLADEFAYMIDRALDHLGGLEGGSLDDDRVSEAEQLVRRHKVGKPVLASLLSSLGASPLSSKASARQMLESFIGESPASRVDKLMDLLESQRKGDDYLAGIGTKRQ